MLQKILSLITIFALVGIGSITLIAMVSHAGCLAQTLQGGGCPANVGSISFFNFHINAFSQLSLAISLFFFLFAVTLLVRQISIIFQNFANLVSLQTNPFCFSLQKFQEWLSQNELSPSYI